MQLKGFFSVAKAGFHSMDGLHKEKICCGAHFFQRLGSLSVVLKNKGHRGISGNNSIGPKVVPSFHSNDYNPAA
jgi:hypothetical protein